MRQLHAIVIQGRHALVLLLSLLLGPAAAAVEPGDAQLSVSHLDELGDWYSLQQAEVRVDGVPLRLRALPADKQQGQTLRLFDGPLAPGRHRVEFRLVYTGSPPLFSYAEDYRFLMRGRVTLQVSPGMHVELRTLATERQGLDVSWEQRPAAALEVVPREAAVDADVSPVERSAPGAPVPMVEAPVEGAQEESDTSTAEAEPPAACPPPTLYFATADTRLDEAGREALARFAACLPKTGRVRVVGHSDARGEGRINIPLGQGRAQTVAGVLHGLGVAVGRLSLDSAGEAQPACFGHEESCHRRNRRVEVQWLAPEREALSVDVP